MKQVDKQHYNFTRYSHKGRWVSYYHQLDTLLKYDPASVVEVGVGDGVVGHYLKQNTNVRYVSVDIDPELHPDIVGSILNIPLESKSEDIVCAFEVLEHLPFEQLESALQEMARVSRKYVIFSVPHFGPPMQFLFKIPFIKIQYAFKIPWPIQHVFNGQHYWEIGKRGFSLFKIKSILRKHFSIVDDFVPFENQYHHFFVLQQYE